jgi:ERCC4-related helicase
MAAEGSRGHKSILNDPHFIEAKRKLKNCLNAENPKVAELKRVLESQIHLKPNSRVIIFTQYRDTVNMLNKALNNGIFKVERFVGQGEREGDPGMSQEQQRIILEKLRGGDVNVLVATSIAEEGLAIPEVDHVIFYEPVPSEIRYIQRRGRTGRRVAGKVTILIAEDTVDEAFYWSSISRARKMKRIISQLNRKLPEILKGESKTLETTLTQFQKTEAQVTAPIAQPTPQTPAGSELWRPTAFQTKVAPLTVTTGKPLP